MLRAEVAEDGDVEDAAVDPAEHEGVAGHLHGDRLHAALPHDGEQGLEVGGLGGGPLGPDALVADARLDGADQPGGAPGGPEAAFDEVRGGGLAGRAGDPDGEEAGAGTAVDLGGEFAHPAARVVGHQDGQAGRRGAVGSRRVGEDRGGAEAGGLGGEVGAVQPGARQRGVHVPGAYRPGVVGDAGDPSLERPVRPVRSGCGQPGGQFAEGVGRTRAGRGAPGCFAGTSWSVVRG